jgi:hypothetical protein
MNHGGEEDTEERLPETLALRRSLIIRLAVVLVLAALSTGCLVVSLQPAYDDQAIVFEDALLGRWENADDRTMVLVERAEWRSYKLTYTDRSAAMTLHANLTSIGSALYLDITRPRGTDPGPYLLPTHGMYRLELNGDTLRAAALDYAWFTNAVKAKTLGRLAAAIDDRRNIVIVSPAEELRAWLTKPPEGALAVPATYRRLSGG